MYTTPFYKKPFSLSATSALNTEPLPAGTILVQRSANHSKQPPTNGEHYEFTETFNARAELYALLRVTYRVEDWGSVTLDDAPIMDLTHEAEAPTGAYGGHVAWAKTCTYPILFGEHTLVFIYLDL